MLIGGIICLGGCDSVPRDQVGTLERIANERVMRVGMIATAVPAVHLDRLQALVERSAEALDARPQIIPGAAEPLLLQLEEGEIDLVVGEFDKASPWMLRVHLLPALAEQQRHGATIETTAAARNGENGWIMLLEREARALGAR